MAMKADPRLDPRNNPACRDVDPEIFFPLAGRNDVAALARAICNRCPVKNTCLEWAYDSKQPDGILGGLTARERQHARRQAAKERAEVPR